MHVLKGIGFLDVCPCIQVTGVVEPASLKYVDVEVVNSGGIDGPGVFYVRVRVIQSV